MWLLKFVVYVECRRNWLYFVINYVLLTELVLIVSMQVCRHCDVKYCCSVLSCLQQDCVSLVINVVILTNEYKIGRSEDWLFLKSQWKPCLSTMPFTPKSCVHPILSKWVDTSKSSGPSSSCSCWKAPASNSTKLSQTTSLLYLIWHYVCVQNWTLSTERVSIINLAPLCLAGKLVPFAGC